MKNYTKAFALFALTLGVGVTMAVPQEFPTSFRDAGLTQLADNFGTFTTEDDIVRMPSAEETKRTYLRTINGNFAAQNFQAEVTILVQGGGGTGCGFFGIGRGEANPNFYREPSTSPSLYCRLAPSNF